MDTCVKKAQLVPVEELYTAQQQLKLNERCESHSSGEELKVTRYARSVKYREVDAYGVPGLRFQKGNAISSASWTPVIPIPIAVRATAKAML